MPFPRYFKKAYHLTEKEVRYVIEHTASNLEAAEFLRIRPDTWKKYASLYFDEETGKSLYKLHAAHTKKRHRSRNMDNAELIQQILDGQQPVIRYREFKRDLFRNAIFEEKCMWCDYQERRVIDFTSPILIVFRDGNWKNGQYDNIAMICFNCYFKEMDHLQGMMVEPPNFKIKHG